MRYRLLPTLVFRRNPPLLSEKGLRLNAGLDIPHETMSNLKVFVMQTMDGFFYGGGNHLVAALYFTTAVLHTVKFDTSNDVGADVTPRVFDGKFSKDFRLSFLDALRSAHDRFPTFCTSKVDYIKNAQRKEGARTVQSDREESDFLLLNVAFLFTFAYQFEDLSLADVINFFLANVCDATEINFARIPPFLLKVMLQSIIDPENHFHDLFRFVSAFYSETAPSKYMDGFNIESAKHMSELLETAASKTGISAPTFDLDPVDLVTSLPFRALRERCRVPKDARKDVKNYDKYMTAAEALKRDQDYGLWFPDDQEEQQEEDHTPKKVCIRKNTEEDV